jgi:hypothetical protein
VTGTKTEKVETKDGSGRDMDSQMEDAKRQTDDVSVR